jgi:metal-responsive CopG/Arc/MetJ family transcriptional regulator
MKLRRYTQGITIFTSAEMYAEVKQVSDERQISLSELFREMIAEYFNRRQSSQSGSND